MGCRSQEHARVDFSDTPRDYLAKDYPGVYTRWTRHEYALHDADKALEVWATFKSWDFREAFIELLRVHLRTLPVGGSARSCGKRSALPFEEAFEFHVTAQSSVFKWNDLEKTPSSPWQIRLVRRARATSCNAERVQAREAPRRLRD